MTDTGGNISLLPTSVIDLYYAQVEGAFQQSDGSWGFPCNSTLPDFVFGIGSSEVVVPPVGFIFDTIDDVNCSGAVQATDGPFAYFSLPIFKGLYVVHDLGANRIGFAERISLTS